VGYGKACREGVVSDGWLSCLTDDLLQMNNVEPVMKISSDVMMLWTACITELFPSFSGRATCSEPL